LFVLEDRAEPRLKDKVKSMARQALRLDRAFLPSLNALATPISQLAADLKITIRVSWRLASSEPETKGRLLCFKAAFKEDGR